MLGKSQILRKSEFCPRKVIFGLITFDRKLVQTCYLVIKYPLDPPGSETVNGFDIGSGIGSRDTSKGVMSGHFLRFLKSNIVSPKMIRFSNFLHPQIRINSLIVLDFITFLI
jgi:hypothetical protein